MKIQLTDQIIITDKHEYYSCLLDLCHLSKNLYNAALYNVRQQFFKDGSYLNYNTNNHNMVSENNVDYKAMPYAQCAQQILRIVDKNYSSFFSSLKSPKVKKARIPKYKDKAGHFVTTYTNQCFRVINGHIRLKISKDNYIYIKTDKTDIQQIRIIPHGNHLTIEIIYNKEYNLKEDNYRYASIDLGVSNLCTLTTNVETNPVIYNGRQLKSINHYWNKKKAKLQSKLEDGKYTSKRIKRISYKRSNKVKDYLHKVSKSIVDNLVSNNINTLFIGKNTGWKKDANLGVVNNQNFVQIPYNDLIQMLSYKCKLHGIDVRVIKESYTSKCSFLDNEEVCKHRSYCGKRVKRGLFQSKSNKLINADVNGSYNIMRLGLQEINVTLDVGLRPENMRLVYNPVKIKIS